MESNMRMVMAFHDKYQLPISARVQLASSFVRMGRMKLLRDEVREYVEAETANDLENIAKELADIVYICYGTAVAYGFNLDTIFRAVHESNMTKDGTIDPMGKLLKGTGYQPPNIQGLLHDMQ